MPDEFIVKLESCNQVLLTTHEQPDADGVGSILGLAWRLRGLGKKFRLVVTPRLPGFLNFLDPEKWIEPFDADIHKNIAAWPDCWVLADASELSRLGPLKDSFLASKAAKLCIDHHLPGDDAGAFDIVILNSGASSTCELVTQTLGISMEMPLPMAQALYAGLVDDTGSFRFPCTSARAHKIAAALLERGVKPDAVHRELYNQATPAKMRIAGLAFERMQLHCNERLAVMTVSLADMESVGAIHEDLEGLVNKPMELRAVEVSAIIYEKLNSGVKVSMRSKSRVNVNAVCRSFGGGGHRLASGATLSGDIASALESVVPVTIARIEQDLGL
ncbi:MAG: bifunctional oligoribonuclease/PAP phosphatase NrnA [Holophagales bacterium]|nr:bifunctional oligoribonuclease/PAP phosphatase NrnA [Holophagales bacterium]